MTRLALRVSMAAGLLVWALPTLARELSFEDRVKAQEAIERAYYSHRIGATRSFEEAVPREVLEAKVRKYLQQSAALAHFWKTPITDEMLDRELARIARGSRLRDRLLEVYASLGQDAFVIKECLARATLAGRLSRNAFAFDRTLHAQARARAEELERRLSAGELDPFREHPDRTVALFALRESEREPLRQDGEEPSRIELAPEEFRQLREAGEQTPRLEEEREAFIVRWMLEEAPGELRVASYVVPKTSWDAWWGAAKRDLEGDGIAIAAVASDAVLPVPDDDADGLGSPEGPCGPENTWDNGSLDDTLHPRYGHTAVWTGSEMLIWGGEGTNEPGVLKTGARYDPSTDTWTPMATAGAPEARLVHSAVWTGSVMVVWGGFNLFSSLNTGGRYDPSTDSWTPTSVVGAPLPRYYHATVWTGSAMIVWGGASGTGGVFDTGGRYDPSTNSWTPTSMTGAPLPVVRPTPVWTGSVMVVWGAVSESDASGGRYDPLADTWAPMSMVGAPTVRNLHTAVWTGDVMVVWGGRTALGATRLHTGGRYDPVGDTWLPTEEGNAPTARDRHTAVWTGLAMVIWGGEGPTALNTGRAYYPASNVWGPATSTVGAPPPSAEHTAVWTGSEMVVWGGNRTDFGGRYDPLEDTWTSTTAGPIAARNNHTAVWTGNAMLVWGGNTNNLAYLDSGGQYDPVLDTWTRMSTEGAPSPRNRHTAVWTGNEMVVWGGTNGSLRFATGGRYDPVADSWAPTSLEDVPIPRFDHTAVWTDSEMVIWGGSVPGASATGGRYDPVADSWAPTSLVDAPAPRFDHTAVWAGSEMVVWGGSSLAGSYLNTGGRYDPSTDSWAPTSTVGAPSPRQGHTAVWTGSVMVVWGGHAGGDGLSTGNRYNLSANTWSSMSNTDNPPGRAGHTAVWTGSKMVVWGGGITSAAAFPANYGRRYDPVVNSWQPVSTVGTPSLRNGHTAVWTGSAMIVWGGNSLNSGGRYFVGASSVDSDGDGHTECTGDCNDTNPDVHPGATEACNGLDDDCNATVDDPTDSDGDGYVLCADCAPGDPGAHSSPDEVTGLAFASGRTTLSWNSAAPGSGSATVHDVARGLLSKLPAGSGIGETCPGPGTSASFLMDSTTPGSGLGFWYLVRGRNACAVGTYGYETGGAERDPVACP